MERKNVQMITCHVTGVNGCVSGVLCHTEWTHWSGNTNVTVVITFNNRYCHKAALQNPDVGLDHWWRRQRGQCGGKVPETSWERNRERKRSQKESYLSLIKTEPYVYNFNHTRPGSDPSVLSSRYLSVFVRTRAPLDGAISASPLFLSTALTYASNLRH